MIRVRHLLQLIGLGVLILLAINPPVLHLTTSLLRSYPPSRWWILDGFNDQDALVGLTNWIYSHDGGVISAHIVLIPLALVFYQLIKLVTEEFYFLKYSWSYHTVVFLAIKYSFIILPILMLNPLLAWIAARYCSLMLLESYICEPEEFYIMCDLIGGWSCLYMMGVNSDFISDYLEELTYPR